MDVSEFLILSVNVSATARHHDSTGSVSAVTTPPARGAAEHGSSWRGPRVPALTANEGGVVYYWSFGHHSSPLDPRALPLGRLTKRTPTHTPVPPNPAVEPLAVSFLNSFFWYELETFT